ncbi:MAG TPA: gephyrin-like molybdotransferase Glp [Bacteroidota bacterium]|nr:gephyrin-like molybdotransferase Glp [Bacteroidota bacterium]
MISAEEAKNIIFSTPHELRGEVVPLADAHHRVLYHDVRSNDDIPPFKNSSMDGFAVHSPDTEGARPNSPIKLPIQLEVAAGDATDAKLAPKKAIRILTGAPLPSGADTVIPLELVVEREGGIVVSEAVPKGRNVREQGEDIRSGEVVLRRGTHLRSAHIGVLASIGCSRVEVFHRPTMAILTTGNELLAVDDALSGGKIRNSNAYSLAALAHESGCQPVDLGVAHDNEVELFGKIREGLLHDVLITSGGISAGKYDYVLRVIKTAGVDLKFWKVNIKPGMPFAFGVYEKEGKSLPVFCLPGNPVSTVVTYLEFVQPFIFRLMGRPEQPLPLRLEAILDHEVSKSDGKKHYHRGVLDTAKGELHVHSTGNQSSGVLTSLVKANCLIILPDNKSHFKKGERVVVELLPWF